MRIYLYLPPTHLIHMYMIPLFAVSGMTFACAVNVKRKCENKGKRETAWGRRDNIKWYMEGYSPENGINEMRITTTLYSSSSSDRRQNSTRKWLDGWMAARMRNSGRRRRRA